jgi:hypothetical protein
MPNKVQALILEINRVQKTRKTIMKRLQREGEVLNKAKKQLREVGVRPYRRRNLKSGANTSSNSP